MMDQVICGTFSSGRVQPWSRDYVRVVSWNIERGLQFSAILDFLRSAEADLILLQEVDLNVRRTRHLDVANELARSLRLNYVFGKEFQELNAGCGGSPAYHGLATLSPWPISNGRVIRFRRQSDFWKPRWYVPKIELFQRRLGGRISLVADTLIDRQQSVTYNLHLESRGKDSLRLDQLAETLEDAGRQSESALVIIAGDFNLDAGNDCAAAMLQTAGFDDGVGQLQVPTTVSCGPFQRKRSIDWIYISDDVRSDGKVHNTVRASDHYPISARLASPWRLNEERTFQFAQAWRYQAG